MDLLGDSQNLLVCHFLSENCFFIFYFICPTFVILLLLFLLELGFKILISYFFVHFVFLLFVFELFLFSLKSYFCLYFFVFFNFLLLFHVTLSDFFFKICVSSFKFFLLFLIVAAFTFFKLMTIGQRPIDRLITNFKALFVIKLLLSSWGESG